jgi:hypothetical protein
MACARDPSVQYNQTKNNRYANSITGNYTNPTQDTTYSFKCRKLKGFYPTFTPTVTYISITSSVAGQYALVYINGSNFLPPCYGLTYVNFGYFTNLPITFYSPTNLSFVVPLNAPPGNYNVVAVNIYNGNFSPGVNQSYAGNMNISNSITYTIT